MLKLHAYTLILRLFDAIASSILRTSRRFYFMLVLRSDLFPILFAFLVYLSMRSVVRVVYVSVKELDSQQVMGDKGYGRGCCAFEVLSQHFPGGTEEIH